MGRTIERILLWLFVINLGIALGAGLYEARIQVPEWLVSTPGGLRWDAEASLRANTGLRFWAFVTTGPLTLLTVANLAAAWRSRGRLRRSWLTAGVVALADRIFTFAYFIPTMIALQRMDGFSQVDAVATATQWANLNHLRHLILLVALLLALKTFACWYVRDVTERETAAPGEELASRSGAES